MEANTNSILKRQDAHSAVLDEIRFNQLNISSSGNDAIINQPIWIVPFGRNPEFVGRDSIITELRKRLEPTSDFVRKGVLCGLGGVG